MENFGSVTETATPDDAAAPPLTPKALSAFGAIADWCEDQRGEAETTAGRQFRTIWWLLGAGLVLLLTLPLIIAYIDHYLGLEESLPPVVVAEAEAAKALLEANQSEMKAEVDDATAALDALQAEIANGEADLAASETALRAAITSPLAVWRRSRTAGQEGFTSVNTLIAAPDGTLIAAGYEEDESGGTKVLLLRSTDGVDWVPVRPQVAGERLAGLISALMAAPDGTLIAAGSMRGILRSVAATERSGIASSILDDGVLPPDLIVPAGTEQRLRDIADRRAAIVVLQTQEAQQQAFLDTANASFARQEKAVETLKKVATNLDEALRTAEPVRQASRIATRLAIVALLIFLVQIVVNRYRYLQRLAGFYQARTRAFRMLADSDPALGAQLLKGVTATELIASLSPDAIRFDKTATPPTDNLAAILQAGLRK